METKLNEIVEFIRYQSKVNKEDITEDTRKKILMEMYKDLEQKYTKEELQIMIRDAFKTLMNDALNYITTGDDTPYKEHSIN